MQVEREVDIRKRVAEIFNRREDEFDTLLHYNNYLEEVESITFNLMNNIDIPETEKKLASYKEANSQSIKQNIIMANDEKAELQAQRAAEREDARLRREAARRELEEEKREKEQGQRQIIDKLASGQGDAAKIIREGERIMLKRSSARRADAERVLQPIPAAEALANDNSSNGNDTFVIRGLKKRVAPEPEKAYDAFGGLEYVREYYVLQDRYDWEWLDRARDELSYTAGGYDVNEYTQRALSEAFAGLGVSIADEMTAKDAAIAAPAEHPPAPPQKTAQSAGGNIRANDAIF